MPRKCWCIEEVQQYKMFFLTTITKTVLKLVIIRKEWGGGALKVSLMIFYTGKVNCPQITTQCYTHVAFKLNRATRFLTVVFVE